MFQIEDVTGHLGGECYLVLGDRSAVLLDSGFGFCAPRVVERIGEHLNGRELRAILLSHSHYDHVGGAVVIREAYPGAVVVAHPYAAQIFARAGAREQMRSRNRDVAAGAGMSAAGDRIEELSVDREIRDREILSFGEIRAQAVETLGHTRCSVSWYFPDDGLLYLSETLGVAPAYPDVMPGWIIGYRMALDSIRACEHLGATRILASHSGLVPHEFFSLARAAAEETKEFVWSRHGRGMSAEDIFTEYKGWMYRGANAEIQPESAFDLHTQTMIPRLIAEREAGGGGQ